MVGAMAAMVAVASVAPLAMCRAPRHIDGCHSRTQLRPAAFAA